MVLSITRNRNKILERDKSRANVQNCPISERATETTNVLFVRSADLGRQEMLRDARTTASVKLHRGVVAQSQGRHWAGSSDRHMGQYADILLGCEWITSRPNDRALKGLLKLLRGSLPP